MPRYKALQPIHFGWALAYAEGDWVPEQVVLDNGWAGSDPPLVEEHDDVWPPKPPPEAAFVEPSSNPEDQAAPRETPAQDSTDTPSPTDKPAATRQRQK
jgi:hypothetical protein